MVSKNSGINTKKVTLNAVKDKEDMCKASKNISMRVLSGKRKD